MTMPVRVIESERSRAVRRLNECLSSTSRYAALLLIFLLPFIGAAFLAANGAGFFAVLVLLPAVELILAGLLLFQLQVRIVLTGALLLQPLLCLLAFLAFCTVMTGAVTAADPATNLFATNTARVVLLLGCLTSFAVLLFFLSLISRIPKDVKIFLLLIMMLVTMAFLAASCLHAVGR